MARPLRIDVEGGWHHRNTGSRLDIRHSGPVQERVAVDRFDASIAKDRVLRATQQELIGAMANVKT